MKKYSIYLRDFDISQEIKKLHQEKELSIGVNNSSNEQELYECINDILFSKINAEIFVFTLDKKINIKKAREKFKNINWIIFNKPFSYSDFINTFAREANSKFIFTMDPKIKITNFSFDDIKKLFKRSNRPSAIAPMLFKENGLPLPTVKTPIYDEFNTRVISFVPEKNLYNTFYPEFGYAIYERKLLLEIDGFFGNIKTQYWQIFNYGAKAWFLGYPILLLNSFKLREKKPNSLVEEITSYKKDLKITQTLLSGFIKQNAGAAHIKHGAFFLFDWKTIQNMKIKINKYQTDFKSLVSHWNLEAKYEREVK